MENNEFDQIGYSTEMLDIENGLEEVKSKLSTALTEFTSKKNDFKNGVKNLKYSIQKVDDLKKLMDGIIVLDDEQTDIEPPSCDINEKKIMEKWANNLFVGYDKLKDELIALEKSLVMLGKADNSEDQKTQFYTESLKRIKYINKEQRAHDRLLAEAEKTYEEKKNGNS